MKEEKFKGKYTANQLARLVVQYGALQTASHKLGLHPSSVRAFLVRFGKLPKLPEKGQHNTKGTFKQQKAKLKPVAGGEAGSPDAKRLKLSGKRFVFTSAQNNTHINKPFWASLQTFCKHNKAQLIVSRFAYNQSGYQNSLKEGEELWYDKSIHPFVCDSSVSVADNLVFCGELDILPTAVDPLSGFDSYCGGSSGIIPHTKVAMKSLPRLKGEDARFLYTTGAVTLRNYIQRKAGQKAEFHHVYGALYVEVDADGVWFARQLIADSKGEFHDLTKRYGDKRVANEARVEGINWGDIHIEKEDKQVSRASWDSDTSILAILRPRSQFVHDLTDFSARNHHEIGNPYFIAKKYFGGEDSVEEGLQKSAEFLDNIQKYGKVIVVESNHHEAYERWLRDANIKADPHNAEFFHESNARLFRAIRLGERFDIYEWALRKHGELKNVTFLKSDESFVLFGKSKNGIECGIHGHRGINGARGSSGSFRAIGKRVNVGHSHSAGIMDGVYTAGVSGKLDMGYNKGPSSWSHSHIITYANGKRAIITIRDGKWRA